MWDAVNTVASPRLSAVQRAYTTAPEQFVASVYARAESLFESGYRAHAVRMPFVFVVQPPDPKRALRNGSPGGYLVHAVKGTCSCPFFSKQEQGELLTEDGTLLPCKHLLGLEKLVRESVGHYRRQSDLYRHYRLRSQWMDVLAERHRQQGTPPSAARRSPSGSVVGATLTSPGSRGGKES